MNKIIITFDYVSDSDSEPTLSYFEVEQAILRNEPLIYYMFGFLLF